MSELRLNVDVATAITDFEEVAREFRLKEKLYRIIFRGRGPEFDRYRFYNQDDDALDIDWKASLKAQRLLIKQYKEERDLKIMFVIDVSDNMVTGSTNKLKCEFAAEAVAAMSNLMISQNDKIGYIFFSDKIIKFVPPKGGKQRFYRFTDELMDGTNYGGVPDINKMLDFLLDYLNERIDAVIFVSDFLKLNESSKKNLKFISFKFESIAVMVRDPLDKSLPDIDREVVIQDPTTGQQLLINPKKAKKIYERNAFIQESLVKDILLDTNIDLLELDTSQGFAFPLALFLTERVKQKGYFI